jgi:BirA family biotin operon repressor/biotin-[acetyl-CoA-carboxylase] ligase
MLSQETLEAVLNGRAFRFFPVTDSTNDDAIAWLSAGADAGAVVVADEQRKGRGRMGRVWHTPPGVALAVSVVLKPPPQAAARAGMLGAVAVAELCEELGAPKVTIKWPNDVQIDGRKVCGILPQAVWRNETLVGVVLGMGVNVRVRFEGELAQTAVSLEDVLARPLHRAHVLASLLARVDAWAGRMTGDALLQAWKARLSTLGQEVRVDAVQGLAVDVDSDGALLIETQDGIARVVAGDIHGVA